MIAMKNNTNILLSKLPKYDNLKSLISALEYLPNIPNNSLIGTEISQASSIVNQINDIYLVGPSQMQTAISIYMLITNYYSGIDVNSPKHINKYYRFSPQGDISHQAGLVQGQPGVGKTKSILKTLSLFPQVIQHDTFPHFRGSYLQVVWFSVSIKSHTRKGFAIELAEAWNNIFLRHDPNCIPPISQSIISKGNTDEIFRIFIQSAINHGS